MKDFLKAENFYLKKESGLKSICLILLAASIVLALWLRSVKGSWDMDNLLEPLGMVVSISIFLYFIIPFHACFFSTEGFETGTIKNVLSSGKSRITYYIGKFISEVKIITWCLVQFYGVFLVLCYLAALVSGAEIKNIGLEEQMSIAIPAVLYNLLYLTAYAAIVLMIGIIMRKTASAAMLTFALIFGDLLVSGYWKESADPLLRTISQNSLMTQIFKFSGMYVVNSQRILLSGTGDYIRAAMVPVGIIIICISIALLVFNKRDI